MHTTEWTDGRRTESRHRQIQRGLFTFHINSRQYVSLIQFAIGNHYFTYATRPILSHQASRLWGSADGWQLYWPQCSRCTCLLYSVHVYKHTGADQSQTHKHTHSILFSFAPTLFVVSPINGPRYSICSPCARRRSTWMVWDDAPSRDTIWVDGTNHQSISATGYLPTLLHRGRRRRLQKMNSPRTWIYPTM